MHEKRFSAWLPWSNREHLPNAACPGVYIIARSSHPLAGQSFTWSKDIIYVGMTNAASGLRGRLRKFDRTLSGQSEHGGADRVRFRFPDAEKFRAKAYVAVAHFECDPQSNRSEDLRLMGEVTRFEYECLACFVEQFGQLPEFNDKKRSPKKGDGRRKPRARRRG